VSHVFPANANVKHPEISVQLNGEDGNGFVIASRVRMALTRAGVPQEEREEFWADALSGDYHHLLATCMAWVDVS
jgi:hypothetical protein